MLCSRWVYIFGMENEGDLFGDLFGGALCQGLYKIGTTVNPVRRWQQVQVHSPWDLRVFAVVPGGYELESGLHKAFDGYRIRGEWFGISRREMHDILDELEGHLELGKKTFPTLPWYSIVYAGVEE